MALGGRFVMRARGGSMHPWLPDGAVVEVVPVALDQLDRGDIILASHAPELYTVHRVVGRLPDGRVLTKGDSLDSLDPPVGGEALLGKVRAFWTEGWRVDGESPRVRRANALLAVCSMASLSLGQTVAEPLGRVLGPRFADTLKRFFRVPGWLLAWAWAKALRRPAGPGNSGPNRDRSGGHWRGGSTAPSQPPPGP